MKTKYDVTLYSGKITHAKMHAHEFGEFGRYTQRQAERIADRYNRALLAYRRANPPAGIGEEDALYEVLFDAARAPGRLPSGEDLVRRVFAIFNRERFRS